MTTVSPPEKAAIALAVTSTIASALRPAIGIGASIMTIVAAPSVISALRGTHPWWAATTAVFTWALLVSVFIVLGTRAGDLVRSHAVSTAAVLALVVAANPLVYMAVHNRAFPNTGMVLIIVAVGAILINQKAALIVIALFNVAWITMAATISMDYPARAFGVELLMVNILAIGLNFTMISMVRRLEASRALVDRLAHTDPLTNVANRRFLMTEGIRRLEQAASHGHGLSVIMLDIDGLKQVNDQQGHSAGDELIVSVVDALVASVRSGDLVARLGGDEFAIVMTYLDESPSQAIIERTRASLAARGHSASIGSIDVPKVAASDDFSALLGAADVVMYETKTARPIAASPRV